MPTARTLEEKWKQVLRESAGTVTKAVETNTAFGLLDFIALRLILAWGAFQNL
jgi:hypothetical protein